MCSLTKCEVLVLFLTTVFFASQNAENVMKILRSTCVVHDEETIQNVSCWARPVSRTESVVNMRGNLTRLVTKAHINIQVYRRSELTFRPFLVNVTEDYCMFFAKNTASEYLRLLTSIYLPYTNMNHTCPYIGPVTIKDLPLNKNNLPPLWPVGEYRLDVMVIADHGKMITMLFFFEVKQLPRRW